MANQGLQDLYDWLGGENWKCNDGWLDPGSDVREWYGLTITTAGDLVSINLISNDLEVLIHDEGLEGGIFALFFWESYAF